MRSPLVVGVDIDDVLYDWSGRAHELSLAAGIAGDRPPAQITSWTPYVEYGCSADSWHAVIHRGVQDGTLYSADPLPGAGAALQALVDAGHQVQLITARGCGDFAGLTSELVRQQTRAWVDRHALAHHGLTFSADKTVVRTDVFVDDNADNVARLCAAGTRGYLMDRPWNAHVTHVDRVRHIDEFVRAVLADRGLG
ncbi:5' nucleotidase, NT5C type [Ruania alba]|uniref:5' nucleotidase, deoxy (Pyrimidine), type C protein (NT5C) n=1 Tax=Ruania alba TaxID=648782 RepID=A0A1H5GJT4_9MICO|nr:hypothetical protein [Ruania alba]SEE15681.1 5' nucleotidase, deoxy (Pyrimidine), type C protein (NT5C) [Ruania alba]